MSNRSRSRSLSPPKINEGKQEIPDITPQTRIGPEIFDLHLLPKDVIMEIFGRMENKSPYLATAKSTRKIIEPMGEFERFFKLPIELQNEILNKLGYEDVENLLLTSKIVQGELKKGSKRRNVSNLGLFKNIRKTVIKLIEDGKFREALDQFKQFIIDHYLLILSDENLKNKMRQFTQTVTTRMTQPMSNIPYSFDLFANDDDESPIRVRKYIDNPNIPDNDRILFLQHYLPHFIFSFDNDIIRKRLTQIISFLEKHRSAPNVEFLLSLLYQLKKS